MDENESMNQAESSRHLRNSQRIALDIQPILPIEDSNAMEEEEKEEEKETLSSPIGQLQQHHTPTSLLPSREGFRQSLDIVKEGKSVIIQFLKGFTCYELIKNSGKACCHQLYHYFTFYTEYKHYPGAVDIRSAPLWHAAEGRFVGLITATDFVNILRHFYIRGSPMSELSEHSIASWRAVPASVSGIRYNEMISISPEDSLYTACKMLCDYRIHRLPVLDAVQNSVLTMISHSGILEFLVSSFREERRLFDQSVRQLGIGRYENILTATENTPLIRVLHMMIEKQISSVPIINAHGCVVDMYRISNVTELTRDRSFSQLDTPVGEFLKLLSSDGQSGKQLHLYSPDDTLHMLFEKFAAVKASQLVCVDQFSRCIGIVAIGDLFNYFLK